MDNFRISKNEQRGITVTGSPFWRLFDFVLLLACVLIVDFEIGLRFDGNAPLYAKFSFLAGLASQTLRSGAWLASGLWSVPCALIVLAAAGLGRHFKYEFDGVSNRARLVKSFCLIPVEKRDFAFEAAKEIYLNKKKGRGGSYDLTLEEGSGRKIKLLSGRQPERLWSLAKKIQEVTNLPVIQKIHS